MRYFDQLSPSRTSVVQHLPTRSAVNGRFGEFDQKVRTADQDPVWAGSAELPRVVPCHFGLTAADRRFETHNKSTTAF